MWLIRFIVLGSGFFIMAYGVNELNTIAHEWAVCLGATLIYFSGVPLNK